MVCIFNILRELHLLVLTSAQSFLLFLHQHRNYMGRGIKFGHKVCDLRNNAQIMKLLPIQTDN